jgi:polyhydroxyalkanoate synthesis regulator phasin
MSARLNLSLGIGTLAVMLIMSFGVLYFTNQGVQQGEERRKDIEQLRGEFNDFVDKWTERIKIGNTNTNNTQKYIIDGVNEILHTVKQEFGNLTAHRLVTNATFDKIQNVLNETKGITSQQYDNQSQKRVDAIIANMNEKFDILFKGLNITKTDTNTESYDAIKALKKQIDELEKSNIPPGLMNHGSQGPKTK